MTADALKVLRVLRDSTGEWHTRPLLRGVLGASPEGFGEPVVGNALYSIQKAGIHVEESISDEYGPLRENVYRLP